MIAHSTGVDVAGRDNSISGQTRGVGQCLLTPDRQVVRASETALHNAFNGVGSCPINTDRQLYFMPKQALLPYPGLGSDQVSRSRCRSENVASL